MPGTDHKRFCNKCDHHVHDITDLNFTQIDKLRTKNNGKLCGVIRLSRNIALTAGIATLAACNNTHEVVGVCSPSQSLTETLPKQTAPKTPTPPIVEPLKLMGEVAPQPQPEPKPRPPKLEPIAPNQQIMGKVLLPEPRALMGRVAIPRNIGED